MDHIPFGDNALFTLEQTFLAFTGINTSTLGLATDLTLLATAAASWEDAYTDHQTNQTAAQDTRQLKGDHRATFEAAICALVRRFQASPSVSDVERRALDITVCDGTMTSAASPARRAPLPSSKPLNTCATKSATSIRRSP
jgi:hypothetical protein